MARDDAASAERLMRDALALQESTADTPRDEIAKTLNNLAVVCEMTGKMGDAETCYRRAYKIALATLPASDPFVTTSRENLEEFCKARGLPVERPAPPASSPPAVETTPDDFAPEPEPEPASEPALAPAPAPAPAPALAPAPAPESPAPSPRSAVPIPAPVPKPAPKTGGSRLIMAGVIGVIVVGLVIVAARMWSAPSPASNIATPVATPAPEPTPAPGPTPAPDPTPAPVVTTKPEPPRPVTRGMLPTVRSAQVCRSLVTRGEWTCTEASSTVPPGTLYFYTRVTASADTTVEHRWYLRDRLHQRVELRIGSNQSGFRTYSRTTITAERAGPWKVELRSADGRVLHEENFVVR